MKSPKVFAAALMGLMSIGRVAAAQSFPDDTAHFHGGPVLSPNITCLLWTPASATYSSSEIQTFQDYLLGVAAYLGNGAAPPGGNGAGTEPVPRQYGTWGAYFSGTCQQDTTPPSMNQLVDLDDHSSTSAIASEVTAAYGSSAYGANNLVIVFTRGWAEAGGNQFAQHWSIGDNQYLAADATDRHDFTIIGHEIIEAATDPVLGTGWFTDQNQADVAPCVQANNGIPWGSEVCDDGGGTAGVLLQTPLADGFGSSSNTFVLSDAIDDVDGGNTTWSCGGTNTCAAIGNGNQCASGNGVQTVLSGNAFTSMTTTFPVTVVQTGTNINVLTRTPTGIAHLVSSDGGATYAAVYPAPAGNVTDTLAAYSKDGTTIDMFGRGTDGFLYQWTFDGTTWGPPVGLGRYLLGPPSAAWVNINGWQHGLVWVTSNDRQIYVWVSEGGWFYSSMPANVQAMSPPQVFSRNNTVDIYFTGTDGHVYLDAGWTGGWQQVPGNGFGLLSATSQPANQNRMDVFVKSPVDKGGSGMSWAEYQSGSLVASAGLGLPVGKGPTAAVNYGSSSTVWLFFVNGAQIYRTVSDSTGTSYPSATYISSAPNVTSPITAFAPDANTVLAFARSQSNGHLIQLRWVGTSLQPVQDLGIAIM